VKQSAITSGTRDVLTLETRIAAAEKTVLLHGAARHVTGRETNR
jgi:hypothetical protein